MAVEEGRVTVMQVVLPLLKVAVIVSIGPPGLMVSIGPPGLIVAGVLYTVSVMVLVTCAGQLHCQAVEVVVVGVGPAG